jgi:hypothetical protein
VSNPVTSEGLLSRIIGNDFSARPDSIRFVLHYGGSRPNQQWRFAKPEWALAAISSDPPEPGFIVTTGPGLVSPSGETKTS